MFQRKRYANQDNFCIAYTDTVTVMILYSWVMNINEFDNIDLFSVDP